MAFRILVDTVQQRLASDGLSTLVGAQDWDPAWCFANYTLIDGITGTVLLLPAILDQGGWLSSNTGIYAKIPPTDFTFSPSSSDPNWQTVVNNADGSQWIQYNDNTGGAGGMTTYNVAANQAMIAQFYNPKTTANASPLASFGWGSSGDYTTGLSLLLYSDMSADVWQEGVQIGKFTSSGQNAEYGQTDGQIPAQAQDQYVWFMMIPCRERELLVLTSNGGGFSVILPNIPEGNPGGIPITPSAPVWFSAFAGVDTTWQIALCQYVSSGYAIGKQSFWRYDPGASPTGGFQGQIYADQTNGTVVGYFGGAAPGNPCGDGLNPLTAYANNTNGVRLALTLTGSTISSGPYSPTTTPFLYAARGYTIPQLAKTVGPNPLDVTEFTLDCSLEMADSVSGQRGNLTLRDPLAIIAAGVALDGTNHPGALIQAISERPFQIYDDDGVQIFEGWNEAPKYVKGTFIDGNPSSGTYGQAIWGTDTNPAERVEFQLRDLWAQLENFIFKDQYPLDGLTLLQAMTLITDQAGVTDSLDMGGFGNTWNMSADIGSYQIPAAGNVTDSDFNSLIESGDKASDKLDELFKKYAGNAFFALVPMNGYCIPTLLSEADLPSSPALTLYDSGATAIAQGVVSPTYLNLFRSVDVQMLKPEANDIYVQGKDYRLQRPILSHQFDSTSANPITPPGSRLPPWRGQRISYCWNDPDLSTQAACNYALGLLYARLTIARSCIEIDADFNSSVPRGDILQLYFKTGAGIIDAASGALTNPVLCRVKTISARFVYTANDGRGHKWRPSKYVLQAGTDASILNSQHTNLAGIWLEWGLKTLSKYSQTGDANDKNLWRRPYISQDEGGES